MITVKVGGVERQWGSFDDIEESWIPQQITRLERAGEPVCVRVSVALSGVNVGLTAGQCGSGSGGRPPNDDEHRVIELWSTVVKQNGHVNPGEIIAFLHRLRHTV